MAFIFTTLSVIGFVILGSIILGGIVIMIALFLIIRALAKNRGDRD